MNPKDAYQKTYEALMEVSDKEYAAGLLEATSKHLKAKIALQYKDSGYGVAESDLRAEADYEYIQSVKDKLEAKKKATDAKAHAAAVEAYFRIYQTVEASERAANRYQT